MNEEALVNEILSGIDVINDGYGILTICDQGLYFKIDTENKKIKSFSPVFSYWEYGKSPHGIISALETTYKTTEDLYGLLCHAAQYRQALPKLKWEEELFLMGWEGKALEMFSTTGVQFLILKKWANCYAVLERSPEYGFISHFEGDSSLEKAMLWAEVTSSLIPSGMMIQKIGKPLEAHYSKHHPNCTVSSSLGPHYRYGKNEFQFGYHVLLEVSK